LRAIRGDADAYTYCNTEFNSHSDAYGNPYTQPNAHADANPNPMHGEMYTDTSPSPHPGTAPVA